jgi:MscS family membrane protein
VLIAAGYRIGRIRSERVRQRSLLRYWVTILFPIAGLLVPLAFKHVVYEYLTLRGNALYVANFSADLVFLLALVVVILGVSKRMADSVIALPSIHGQGLDAHLIRILCRLLGIIVASIVFLEGGRYLGFPITTLLASAGIGGLAIALSAQGMIRGVFGTVTILLDKPYRVGDRIVVNGQDGTVEEIGLRSTKLRTFLTNHVVSIPNDQMADSEIENIGRRRHVHRMSDIHIPLDTPREKVEKAVAVIRTVLDKHEGMDPEFPPRVFFNDFNPDSFNIRVICWYQPPKLWDFYAFSEKVNLEILRVFEEHGIPFSMPLRHSFWKRDDEQGPLDVNVIIDDSSTGERTA